MDIAGEIDGECEDALKELKSGGERDTYLPLGAFSFMQSFIFFNCCRRGGSLRLYRNVRGYLQNFHLISLSLARVTNRR